MVSMLPMITVATKNLITRRIALVFQPFVELSPMVKKPHFFSKLAAIIIDMVKREEKGFGFTAAGASIATISSNGFILKAIVIVKRNFATPFRVVLVPFNRAGSIFNRMLFPVFTQPISGTFIPFAAVLFKAFFALTAMPAFLVFCLSALRACFNHKFVSSVIESIIDCESKVKSKVQRLSRKGVGPSGPKRLAPRTGDDIVCSAWEHAAAL